MSASAAHDDRDHSADRSGSIPSDGLAKAEGAIALALGGGGARGIAHIGVLKVLEERSVPIDMVVGTSIGALGAALYGLEPSWRYVRERVFAFLRSEGFAKYGKGLTDSAVGGSRPGLLGRAWLLAKKSLALQAMLLRRSLVGRRRLAEAICAILPDKSFSDAVLPCAIVALDLATGEEVILRDGSLREAAIASASLAGFFPPVEREGRLLADPSPVSSVPVAASRRLGARGVVAVDIRSRVMPLRDIPSAADAVFRVSALACERANDAQLALADVVINPEVGGTYWSDFHDLEAHVERGSAAALAALPKLEALLGRLGRRPGAGTAR